jgi:hypothetical protein
MSRALDGFGSMAQKLSLSRLRGGEGSGGEGRKGGVAGRGGRAEWRGGAEGRSGGEGRKGGVAAKGASMHHGKRGSPIGRHGSRQSV